MYSNLSYLRHVIVRFTHPRCNGPSHALLEGQTKGAVAAVAAFSGQLLYGEGMLGADNLMEAADEMVDA